LGLKEVSFYFEWNNSLLEKWLHKNTGRLDLTKKRTLDYTKLTRLRCAVLPGMEHL